MCMGTRRTGNSLRGVLTDGLGGARRTGNLPPNPVILDASVSFELLITVGKIEQSESSNNVLGLITQLVMGSSKDAGAFFVYTKVRFLRDVSLKQSLRQSLIGENYENNYFWA